MKYYYTKNAIVQFIDEINMKIHIKLAARDEEECSF